MNIQRTSSAVIHARPADAKPLPDATPKSWTRQAPAELSSRAALGPAHLHDSRASAGPELRGKKLGPLLDSPQASKFQVQQDKRAVELESQLQNSKLDHLKPGDLLGSGSGKEAFDLPGQGRALLACKPGAPSLSSEILNLELLRSTGMPTAKVLEVGSFEGRDAMVMPKYEHIFKPAAPDTAAGREFLKSPLVNANTRQDLAKIRDTIKREEIVVFDLQYGIDKAGHLHVLDPMGVIGSGNGLDNKSQLRQLDALIGAISPRRMR